MCLREKLEINRLEPKFAINRKTELFKQCIHKWRHKLSAFDYEKELLKLTASDSQERTIVDDNSQLQPILENRSQVVISESPISIQNLEFHGQDKNNSQNRRENQESGRYLTRRRAKELGHEIILDKT